MLFLVVSHSSVQIGSCYNCYICITVKTFLFCIEYFRIIHQNPWPTEARM